VRIYHCVERYAESPGVSREHILTLEQRLLRTSDLVWAVSPPLHDSLSAHHPRVRLMPNVAEVERFADAASEPPAKELLGIPQPRLLYLGNLAEYKVDLTLLTKLAKARPSWAWIFVGPVGRGDPRTDLRELAALENVHLLGERTRAETPAYVAGADLCLLPLRRGESTFSSSPIKTYEYLAAGKQVVAGPIPALEDLAAAGLVRCAGSAEEWLTACEAALLADGVDSQRRRTEAMRHGWGARMEEIERILAEEVQRLRMQTAPTGGSFEERP